MMEAMVESNGRKKGNGRKKVEIKKIEKKSQLIVTFSKRRQGLFKKARDLCLLCGGDAALIVFSPTGKLYTFGSPSVGSVIDRLIKDGYHLDNQNNARDVFDESPEREISSGFWFDLPIENMGLDQLQAYKASLEEIKKKAEIQAREMMVMDYLSINGRIGGNNVGMLHDSQMDYLSIDGGIEGNNVVGMLQDSQMDYWSINGGIEGITNMGMFHGFDEDFVFMDMVSTFDPIFGKHIEAWMISIRMRNLNQSGQINEPMVCMKRVHYTNHDRCRQTRRTTVRHFSALHLFANVRVFFYMAGCIMLISRL